MPMTILLVIGAGGFTHAAPVLELGRILAGRGHRIEFATQQGQEKWVQDDPYFSFIQRVHTMGPCMTDEAAEKHYLGMQDYDPRNDWLGTESLKPLHTVAAFWTSDYAYLKDVILPACKPDFILSDFFVDAVRDMQYQTGIPIALVWPQMPYGMCNASYIPGMAGFQEEALTSEHASLLTRLRAELRPLARLPAIVGLLHLVRCMRRAAGVTYSLPMLSKPNYLALVNSFWGLEVPKELPPLVAAVGPILFDEYPPLDAALKAFFESHKRVLYVAFGTHLRILPPDAKKFVTAIDSALQEGLIDGVVWAANGPQMKHFDRDQQLDGGKYCAEDILVNRHSSWYFTPFAPQRAVLAHEHTVLFMTHGGGSSVNEALYHGTPMLVLGFFFDQLTNAMRLVDAGVALSLDKANFPTDEVLQKTRQILVDADSSFAQNVQRMQHTARVSSRKKEYAADLIEEVMYDHHFSLEPPGASAWQTSKRRRPMHLETADMRMLFWRAKNWDLWLSAASG